MVHQHAYAGTHHPDSSSAEEGSHFQPATNLALLLFAIPIEDDGPGQISRPVDIVPFLQARVEPQ